MVTKPKSVEVTTKELTWWKNIKRREVSLYFDKIPTGTKYKAVIQGKKCEGLIYNRFDRLFFCHNNTNLMGCGSVCPNKMGFKYSYDMPLNYSLSDSQIKNLVLYAKNKGFKYPLGTCIASRQLEICNGYIRIGGERIENIQVLNLITRLQK